MDRLTRAHTQVQVSHDQPDNPGDMPKMINLKVNPEYRKLVPRPTKGEYKALEADIIDKEEATEPIIINQDKVILDGHTRYEICTKHGLFYRTEVREFESELDEKIFVVDVNLKRRHLTDMQKIILAKPLEDLIAEKAKRQQSIAGKIGRDIQLGFSSNEETPHPIDTAKEVAKQIGVSKSTYERGKKIRDEGTPEEIQEASSKPKQITRVHNKIKKRQHLEEAHKKGSPPMPEGVFDIIYADPGWKYDSDASQRGKADNHYATLTTKKIAEEVGAELESHVAENAMLFLWVTNAHLEDGLRVIKVWGFKYITNFVWVKDKIGLGWFARGQHELLLLCRKGEMPHPEDHNRYPTIINAPRREHSVKPEIVYDMIETMYPNRKYLELFSRNQREGWVMWGLEVE